jgi:AraC family transcriptional regulator
MEERTWVRLRDNSEMMFSALATSRSRGWSGISAAVYDTSGGFVQMPASANHNISMHVGASVVATCRCGGPIHRRVQTPGDIDVVPLGYCAAWEDDGPATIVSIDLGPSIIRSAAEAMSIGADRVTLAPQLQLRDPKIESIARALQSEVESKEPFDRLYAEGLGLSLAVHLLRHYGARVPKEPERGLTKRQLQDVIDFVRENLARNIGIHDLAATAGLSASHFKTLFKLSTGLPVHRYVIRRRVDEAVRLLSRAGARSSEVALQVGFADQSHMARCMRKVIGMTPTMVMRQCH